MSIINKKVIFISIFVIVFFINTIKAENGNLFLKAFILTILIFFFSKTKDHHLRIASVAR